MEMSGESLFSLEIVVDKVYIPHIECRFPAAAFRLLDFPTILIEHVESHLAAEIRHKIAMDPLYEAPGQFSQLKDSHGNFMIKKGKSCLFKMTLESTRKHLAATPLYVMVLDKYPTTPKLVGNTTVPLDSLMEQISKDVTRLGLMTPSVKGDKGLFKLHNLMGKEIGYIVIGYRLLFLGPGLIPHLGNPATEVINSESLKADTQVEKLNLITDNHKPIRIDDRSTNSQIIDESKSPIICNLPVKKKFIMVQSNSVGRECADKGITVNIESGNNQTTDENKLISTSTQTSKLYNKGHRKASGKVKFISSILPEENEQETDLINVPNTFCPPPLKYNSSFYPTMWLKRTPPNLEDDSSSVETSDDDSPTNDHKDIQPVSVKSVQNARNKQLDARGIPTSVNNERNVSIQINRARDSNVNVNTVIEHLAEFPILSSLLQEISKLNLPNPTESKVNQPLLNLGKERQRQSKENIVARPNINEGKPDNSVVQNIAEFEEKSSPMTRHGRKSHSNCAHAAPRVPKSAGWLGYEPGFKPKESNLVFKTTVTQNLRLAKAQGSKVTVSKVSDAKKVSNTKAKAYHVEEFDNGNLSDLSTEIKRHTLDDTNISDEPTGIKESFQDQAFTSQLTDDKDAIENNRENYSKAPIMKPKKRLGSSRITNKRTRTKVKAVTKYVPDTENVASPKELNVVTEVSIPKKAESLEIRVPSVEADIYAEDEILAMSPGLQRYEPKFTDITSEASSESVENNSSVFIPSPRSQKVNDSILRSADYTLTESRFHSTGEPELQELMSEDEHSEASDQSNRVDIAYSDSKSSDKNSAATVLHIPLPNPVLSEQSPIPSTRRSVIHPVFNIIQKHKELTQQTELSGSGTVHSEESISRPQPTPRRYQSLEKKDSTVTESVSSYVPSEERVNAVLSDASYSEDFSEDEDDSLSDIDIEAILPKEQRFIPSTKLGYTIG